MATVNGVLGAIDTADLGFTYPHEHVMIADWSMRQAFPDWIDAERVIRETVAKFKEIKADGVRTIVDCTAINIGRDIHMIREVAQQSGIQIIASTGFYHQEYPTFSYHGWDEDKIASLMVREIEDGIQGTDSKAGIIKCATDAAGMTPTNALFFRAVAKAHRATGVPITTHTNATQKTGLVQQATLAHEGTDLSRVVIGHCGDTTDLEYLEQLLSHGSYIGMDRFGLDNVLPNEQRVQTVAKLCAKGYTDQILLSHDAIGYFDSFPWGATETSLPNWHFGFIKATVIPMLLEAGVTDKQIETMTVSNPRRLFEKQGAY